MIILKLNSQRPIAVLLSVLSSSHQQVPDNLQAHSADYRSQLKVSKRRRTVRRPTTVHRAAFCVENATQVDWEGRLIER